VVISGRNISRLNEVAKEFENWRLHEALVVQADVTVEEDCHKLISETVKHYGRIDILVVNAGLSMRALFQEVDLDVIRKLMDTNFWGTVYCVKYALPYLLMTRGTIVGMSSIAGVKGLPGRTGYSASKFAIEGFLETIRIENLKRGLHVLIARPGFTASNIRNTALSKNGTAQGESPLDEGKIMKAEVVAEKICRAVIHRKPELVMSTEGKIVVWLNKFFPRFLDRMVYNKMAKEKDSPLP
jgi:short-subunit dehydrogenase